MPNKKSKVVHTRKRQKKAQLSSKIIVTASMVTDTAQPVIKHGFLLPRGLSGDFNAARNMVMVQALPSYARAKVEPRDLADFRSVLAGLAQRGNRDAIFLTEFESYVPAAETESDRRAFDIIEGKSAIGMNLALLSARTEHDAHALLFVVEDKLREKMVVAGPEKISAHLRTELEKNGVSYVVRNSTQCSPVVNDFVSDGALYRTRQDLLLEGHDQFIVDELVKSLATLCAIPHGGRPTREYTLGQAVHDVSGSVPSCYTQILRPSEA